MFFFHMHCFKKKSHFSKKNFFFYKNTVKINLEFDLMPKPKNSKYINDLDKTNGNN